MRGRQSLSQASLLALQADRRGTRPSSWSGQTPPPALLVLLLHPAPTTPGPSGPAAPQLRSGEGQVPLQVRIQTRV
jgi:hypothetical protein